MYIKYINVKNTPAGYVVTICTPEQYADRVKLEKHAKRAVVRWCALGWIFGVCTLLSLLIIMSGAALH